jgi:hypothetical protein
MMRDLFRESRDLNARSRFTLARTRQDLMRGGLLLTPVRARLAALVVRGARRLWRATRSPVLTADPVVPGARGADEPPAVQDCDASRREACATLTVTATSAFMADAPGVETPVPWRSRELLNPGNHRPPLSTAIDLRGELDADVLRCRPSVMAT